MSQISESVSLTASGADQSVAVIAIDNAPVNALSHHVRTGVADAMAQASADDAVSSVVIICRGRTFVAGADISEFGLPPQGTPLGEVQASIENASKPVVAAIHGTALGGGLELAMTAHYRVGVSSAQFGLPEVKLGLLPGAGGTQRLPRVVGVQKALEMMTSGDRINADEALAAGLIDAIAADDALEAEAIAFAESVVRDGRPLQRIRDRDERLAEAKDNPAIFDDFRRKIARKTRGFDAPEANIKCIEAAVSMDFDAGLARERELFNGLMSGSQSAAQRYYFFAERLANKIPDVPRDTPQLPLASAGVLGAGTMGGGIAMNFVTAGIPVTIVERSQEALDRGLAVVRSNYERSASRGRYGTDGAAEVERRMGMITGSLDKADFADKDIVIEAVFENMDLKKEIFSELDAICKPGAILASNTSALDVNEIATATSRPESVIGLHFFSPANVMKLIEIVRGDATAPEVIATSMALAKRMEKVATLVGVCHGFVGNRMLFARRLEAESLIMSGATPAQVDKVIYDFGMPMGPFSMSDLAGLDIGWSEETSKGETLKERMCESGRRGQKNGRGYYTYDPETRAATPDPEVEQMIRDLAAEQGFEHKDVTDQEVLERLLYPMVNEGAKILEEGIAIRASDVDVVWVNGYGWPVYRGGPMWWADSVGLDKVAETVQAHFDATGEDRWKPSPLLLELAAAGRTFADWDKARS